MIEFLMVILFVGLTTCVGLYSITRVDYNSLSMASKIFTIFLNLLLIIIGMFIIYILSGLSAAVIGG